MRKSRLYTPQALSALETVVMEGPASHYLTRVLRLSTGDPVTLFNGDGLNYQGEICQTHRQAVEVRLTGTRDPDNESPLKITLVQAISRGERMDYSLQKTVELGVCCIQPVSSMRVEVRLDEKRLAKRMAHWRGVIISACEQSGRAVVPELKTPLMLDDWLSRGDEYPRLVLDPLAATKISAYSLASDTVSVLVGPEGGFSDEEMQKIHSADTTAVSFGPRILRTETAGPAAIAALQAIAGDG